MHRSTPPPERAKPTEPDPATEDEGPDDPLADAPAPHERSDLTRLLSRFPLPRRRLTRVQVIALVLFSALTLGPVVAAVAIFRADADTQPELVSEAEGPPTGGVHMDLTVVWVDPVTGELGVRAQMTPDVALLAGGGRLRSELAVASNDVRGNRVTTLPAGQPTGPVEIVTGLRDGSVSRYPFDRYTGRLQLILSRQDAGGPRQEVPVVVTVRSAVTDLGVTAAVAPTDASALGRTVTFDVRRNGPTLAFTIGMMGLWWALSISAVLLVWSVAIWRATVPPWTYGYLVGVLFALTPLRSALPGEPPAGVLVDYVSFYWAIVIVGTGLLMLLGSYFRQLREEHRQR